MSATYLYTPAEAALGRERIVAALRVAVERELARTPRWKSALMMVAQYWADNASDAVHSRFVFSVEDVPVPEVLAREQDEQERLWLETGNHDIDGGQRSHRELWTHDLLTREEGNLWQANYEAVALFAAFTREGADQGMGVHEAYLPYALFTRAPGGGALVQRVGKMVRPWLDGIRPTYDGTEVPAAVVPGPAWVVVTDLVDDLTVTFDPRDFDAPSGERPMVMRATCTPDVAEALDRFEESKRPLAIHVGGARHVGLVRRWPGDDWDAPHGWQRAARVVFTMLDDDGLHDALVRCQQQLHPGLPEDQAALVRIDAELERLGRRS